MTQSVWDGIGEGFLGSLKQNALSAYPNIAKLTQEMPAPPEGSAADKAGQKLQDALSTGTGSTLKLRCL